MVSEPDAPGTYPIKATLNDPNVRISNYTVTNTVIKLSIRSHRFGTHTKSAFNEFVEPFLVRGKRSFVHKVGQRRSSSMRIFKQHRLEHHGADVFLVVINNLPLCHSRGRPFSCSNIFC